MRTYGVDGAQITVLTGLMSLGLRALQEPAAAAMMASVPDEALEAAHPSSCPVCGGRPTLAVVARSFAMGTGRKLACVQCGTSWEYERIRCAHCGCDDVKKLGWRSVKGDKRHRIDFCEECGNYLRTTVVETRTSSFSIDVEDCVMAAMDSYSQQGRS